MIKLNLAQNIGRRWIHQQEVSAHSSLDSSDEASDVKEFTDPAPIDWATYNWLRADSVEFNTCIYFHENMNYAKQLNLRSTIET